jgi:hypothetical protein
MFAHLGIALERDPTRRSLSGGHHVRGQAVCRARTCGYARPYVARFRPAPVHGPRSRSLTRYRRSMSASPASPRRPRRRISSQARVVTLVDSSDDSHNVTESKEEPSGPLNAPTPPGAVYQFLDLGGALFRLFGGCCAYANQPIISPHMCI